MKNRIRWRTLLTGALVAAALLLCGVVLLIGPFGSVPAPGSIRYGLLHPTVPDHLKSVRYQPTGFSSPIAHVPIPQHPFMASNAGSNMHTDASMSDAHGASGPLGVNPRVTSRTQGFGGYGTVAFDSDERLVGVHSNGRRFQLELMDPFTLEELASYDLPPRPRHFWLQGVMPWEYIGAGMYFYLDEMDRAIVPTTADTIRVVQAPDMTTRSEFELVREYDLSDSVVPMSWPKKDSVAWVLPDWDGEFYWYATTAGIVGTVDVATGAVQALRLDGEIIENSFAVGEDGVFIVSDRALYRFGQTGSGEIVTDWRTEYDRGPTKKPGLITRGSGTSVTLLGGPEGVVAITDNAEPQIHLLAVRRADGSLACSAPLFAPGKSATDITVVGFEQSDAAGQPTGVYSTITENNWGHHFFPFGRPEPGITRVDIIPQAEGTHRCEPVWTSNERNLGVFKLSLGNGLLYLYSWEGSPLSSRWYFTTVDFATGETVYRQLTGTGLGYNNWAAAIFLHPQGGVAYSTTIFGLVMLRDSHPIGMVLHGQ
ncbi:hypothetical protein ACFLT5_03160 [Chloroflexota bacterium]